MADELLARVARAIAEHRRARGMSQEGLSEALGIAVKNVQRMEGGRQNLTLSSLERIAAALDVDPGALLARTLPVGEPSALERLDRAGYRVRASTTRGRRPAGAVPITTIRAAAGALSGAAHVTGTLGWFIDEGRGASATFAPGRFVAEVRGRSMEPRLTDGALVLFGPAAGPPYEQRIFLIASNDLYDEELGGPFVVKRIRVVGKTRRELRLESTNEDYAPIVLTENFEAVRVIAEVVRVLLPA